MFSIIAFVRHYIKLLAQKAILFLALFWPIAFSLQAAIYQWTDEQGKVHFSDTPNYQVHNKKVSVNKGNTFSAQSTTKAKWLDEFETKKRIEQKAKAQQKIVQQKRQAVCEFWQSRLEIFKQSGRVAIMSPKGERSYVGEQERKRKISKIRQDINKFCRNV